MASIAVAATILLGSMQESTEALKSGSKEQQKLQQQSECKNNSTCTNDFTSSRTKIKVNNTHKQVNSHPKGSEKESGSKEQQKLQQQSECKNNSTCTNLGSNGFRLSIPMIGNDTNTQHGFQANSKSPPQNNSVPFVLPFP
ncbi:MAG: hypothetical protein M3044_07500 [Thermoproteota archaeon]|nr:hypothetical protein [Thermoproteota archaeon]